MLRKQVNIILNVFHLKIRAEVSIKFNWTTKTKIYNFNNELLNFDFLTKKSTLVFKKSIGFVICYALTKSPVKILKN